MAMRGESVQLIEGADVAAVSQELLKHMKEMIEKARKSRSKRRILRSTLNDLTPLVEEIDKFNQNLDQPMEEIENLIHEKEAGDDLGERHSSFGKCLSFNSRGEKKMARDVKETLNQVKNFLEMMCKDNYGQRIMCLPPQKPEFVIGMDEPLSRLKMELLKDGVSVLGLTGLPGSGKTTLAKMLCWDDQVKGKFGDHILFVTFSKTPNFKVIVEALFQYCGNYAPEFHNEEEAVNGLGLLLGKIAESPILLVLDDVWPNSESLLQNFKFQIPDYKILVTSRVAFPTINPLIHLKPLRYEDSLSLFRRYAFAKDNSSYIPDESLVQEVVRSCGGLPLTIKVVASSLYHQPYDMWQKMVKEWSQGHSILDSNTNLLNFLQRSLYVLEDKSIIKECFMDLGLFPEDQRIPTTALIDMWAELYDLDNEGKEAMTKINKLVSLNLANLIVTRKVESDADNYYSNHFIMQHDLLRELAIYLSGKGPLEPRRRLMVEINEYNRHWPPEEKQQGLIGHMMSFLKRCIIQKQQQPAIARTLSISTDETFTSDWGNMQLTETVVLVLNVHTKEYYLPKFTVKMSSLKVLICTNYGIHTCELKNFELLSSLSNLKRIRLEKVSVPSLVTLKNLQKLSLYMCDISQAFGNWNIPISDALPNLAELSIDYCKDLLELPSDLCDIKPLKKLSISNCHKLSTLPKEIGNLENLEVLRLNSCTDLGGIPDSIGGLSKLSVLDISNCISLRNLPEGMGGLKSLEKLYMTGCSRCELPDSVMNLEHLKSVICDEDTAASWEVFKSMLTNLRIEVPHVDVNLNWLLGTSSSS